MRMTKNVFLFAMLWVRYGSQLWILSLPGWVASVAKIMFFIFGSIYIVCAELEE